MKISVDKVWVTETDPRISDLPKLNDIMTKLTWEIH